MSLLRLFRAQPLHGCLAPLLATVVACASSTPGGGTTNPDDPNATGGSGTTGGSGPSGGVQLDKDQTINVRENNKSVGNGSKLPVSTGDIGEGLTMTRSVIVTNGGAFSKLRISKVSLGYTAAAPTEGDKPAFSCAVLVDAVEVACADYKGADIAPAGKGSPTTQTILVKFFKYNDVLVRNATLHILSNDIKKNTDYALTFYTTAGLAKVAVQPSQVDFGFVPVGAAPVAGSTVLNVGNAELAITQIDLSSLDKDLFKLVWNGKEFPTGAPVNLQPPTVIKANDGIDFSVIYTAKDDKPRSLEILLHTNDMSLSSDGPGVKRVPIKVNSTGPCLLLSPKAVVFGPTPVGQTKDQTLILKACGDEAVVVSKIAFETPPGAGNFSVKWASLKETEGKEPSVEAPLKLLVNGSATLVLSYSPSKLSPLGASGAPQQDLATLAVTSNTAAGVAKATLEGYGASADCPTPIITVAEGDTVTPQTVLHLDGKQSYATGSTISKFAWEVEQAKGSVALFSPNNAASAVTLQPNVAGDYTFRLHVWDQGGKKSCAPAEKKVKVIPDQAIHVELLWKTPGDKDETDSGPGAGSDLDLHFAHQYAAGQDYDKDGKPDPWFAGLYDCFWYNCGNGNTVQWGSYDPNVDDDPSLDRDDTDGAGPENLNLTLPEDGKTYGVGVHYYNDFGLGKSKAVVRIYIYGVLQFEVSSPDLFKGDMWFVAKIAWPQAEIESAQKSATDKTPFVTPKYPAPVLD